MAWRRCQRVATTLGFVDVEKALELWVADGLLDTPTADRLRTHLAGAEPTARTSDESESWTVRFLVMLGAVLIGGGLLVFIAGQWDQQSPMRRLGLLSLVYALIVAAAAVLTRQGLEITGKAFWFLSTVAAGANIFLIGQVFNLPLTWWQGTLLWAIAAASMGFATGSSAQGWLAVPLGVLTLAWLTLPETRWFDQFGFIDDPRGVRALLPAIGLVLVIGSRLVEDTEASFASNALIVAGAALVAIPFVVSTFHPEAFGWFFSLDFAPMHVVIIVACLAVVAAAMRWRPHPLTIVTAAALALVLVVILPQADGGDLDVERTSWLGSVFERSAAAYWLYSAMVFGFAVAVVVAGRRYSLRPLVNVGLGSIGVLVLAFYIGRIAGELPTSLALLGGGLLLTGGGYWLEKRRRDLTSGARS